MFFNWGLALWLSNGLGIPGLWNLYRYIKVKKLYFCLLLINSKSSGPINIGCTYFIQVRAVVLTERLVKNKSDSHSVIGGVVNYMYLQ